MTRLTWGAPAERRYETGVDHGVLYPIDTNGLYTQGYAWNGLTTVTESPSGAESNKQYADNGVYVNLISAEEFGATIEAFTYPKEFNQCNGLGELMAGLLIGQQGRRPFGFSYRTKIGNSIAGQDAGYKLHLIYGCQASPSETTNTTVNDSPEAATFSWEVSTTPVNVGTVGGKSWNPTASLVVDSTTVDAAALAELEDFLYGTAGTNPSMPLPAEVYALFAGTLTTATPVAPAYNSTTKVITIPTTTGVDYQIDGVTRTGAVTITKNTVVTSRPKSGFVFPNDVDTDWGYTF